MKYVLLIAVILGLLFGFSVAANFVAAVLLGSLAFAFFAAAISAIVALCKLDFWSTVESGILACILWWVLSICI